MDTSTNNNSIEIVNNNNNENYIKKEVGGGGGGIHTTTNTTQNLEKQQHESIKEDTTTIKEEINSNNNKVNLPQNGNNSNSSSGSSSSSSSSSSHIKKEVQPQQPNGVPTTTTTTTTGAVATTTTTTTEPTIHGTIITSSMLSGIIGSVSNMNNIQYTNSDSPWGSRSVDSHEKIEQIGEGTFGQVYKAKNKANGDIVALKKVIMDNEVEGFPITAIREIKILKELNHSNVVNLKEVVTSKASASNNHKGSVYMVFEYMDHDLNGLMDSPAFKYFTHAQIKCYLKQLLEGLDYCHRNNVLHRDIKGSNLLLDNNGILKLADFGLARPFNSSEKRQPLTNRVITLWYRPPELLLGVNHYGPEIDMWSVGCIMAELLSKKTLFPGRNSIDQLDKIYQICGSPNTQNWPEAKDLPFWDTLKPKREYNRTLREFYHNDTAFTKEAFDLLDKLLCMDPKKRISASEALDSQYFWIDPLPCNPKDLPRYPSCHEYRTKKRLRQGQQQAQQQAQQAQQQQSQQQQPLPHHPHHPHQQQQQGANVNHNNHHNNNHHPSYQNSANNNFKKQRTDINFNSNPQIPQQQPYNSNNKGPYGQQPPQPSSHHLNQPPGGGYANGINNSYQNNNRLNNNLPPHQHQQQQQQQHGSGNRPPQPQQQPLPQNKNNNFPLNNNNRNNPNTHR